MNDRSTAGPLAALLISCVLTATWPIVGKRASTYFDPLTFAWLGNMIACLCLAPLALREGRWRRIVEPGLRGKLFIIGGVGTGITSLLLQVAMTQTTPANGAIVCQVEVVYSAFLAAWLLGETISSSQGAATALVLTGTGLIVWKDLGTPHWKGDLILLITPWLFQASHIVTKRLPGDLDSWTIASARIFYGGLVLTPFALANLALGRATFSAEPSALALCVYQGAVLSAVTVPLWYMALRRLELAKTTAIMLSYPALTVLFSWGLGEELIGPHQLAGLACSMLGAVWLSSQLKRVEPGSILPEARPEPA